jgi:hypothetical protein
MEKNFLVCGTTLFIKTPKQEGFVVIIKMQIIWIRPT